MYKRNQVEAALHALLTSPGRSARQRLKESVPQVLRTRIKHLLEIDRNWGRANSDRLSEHPMAFYETLPAGTGQDVSYSAFQAFRLAVALELLSFGCKQSEVVEQIALCRDDLKAAFERATRAIKTFGMSSEITLDNVRNHNPKYASIFLVFTQVDVSERMAQAYPSSLKTGERLLAPEVCVGQENLQRFIKRALPKETYKALVIELSFLAARLVELLAEAPLRKRGRS
jgi:hypothetical protein